MTYEQDDAELLAAAADGVSLLWSYDDYALNLRFYVAKLILGRLSFTWHGLNAGTANLPVYALDVLAERAVLSPAARAEIEEVARDVRAREIYGRTVRDRVAAILGLAAYERLSSAACLEQPIEKFREYFADAVDLFE